MPYKPIPCHGQNDTGCSMLDNGLIIILIPFYPLSSIQYPASRPNSCRCLFNEQAVINAKNIILNARLNVQSPWHCSITDIDKICFLTAGLTEKRCEDRKVTDAVSGAVRCRELAGAYLFPYGTRYIKSRGNLNLPESERFGSVIWAIRAFR